MKIQFNGNLTYLEARKILFLIFGVLAYLGKQIPRRYSLTTKPKEDFWVFEDIDNAIDLEKIDLDTLNEELNDLKEELNDFGIKNVQIQITIEVIIKL